MLDANMGHSNIKKMYCIMLYKDISNLKSTLNQFHKII